MNLHSITYLGSIGDASLENILSKLEPSVVSDTMRVSQLFAAENFNYASQSKSVVCGARFDGSEDIGGADCDLVCDGTLIDIKSFKKPKFSAEILRQLIGYFLLDYNDTYSIRSFAIYFSRHKFWRTIDMTELGFNEEIVSLRAEFRLKMRALRITREQRFIS